MGCEKFLETFWLIFSSNLKRKKRAQVTETDKADKNNEEEEDSIMPLRVKLIDETKKTISRKIKDNERKRKAKKNFKNSWIYVIFPVTEI